MSQKLLTLHRYFICANRMRTHFDEVLIKGNITSQATIIDSYMYMGYWYGGLYVVIEGWRALNLSDDIIDGLLKSPNVALLKRYRNGVFHFQKQYYDNRFMDFMKQGADAVTWVRSLNEQFGRYFLDHM